MPLLLAGLLLAGLLGSPVWAKGRAAGDTVLTPEQVESLDRQLDEADTTGSDLWEEYRKYRRRDRDDRTATGDRVKVGDSVLVDEDELVEGDVVSIGGDAVVKGTVEGDVVAVGGDVELHDGAEVRGDVVSVGGRVREVGKAIVRGERVSVNVPIPLFGLGDHEIGMPRFPPIFLGWKLAMLGVGLLLALLFNAIAGHRLDVVSRRVEAEPGQSFLIGLLGAFGTPIALLVSFLLLAITIVGLLLFPVLLILVWLMMLGGFAAVCIAVGRRVAQGRDGTGALAPARSSYWNLSVGFVALHAFLILGMLLGMAGSWGPVRPIALLFGVLGVFVIVFATILGYGAVLQSRLGTQRPGAVAWAGGPAPGAPPPPPPAPGGFTPAAPPPPLVPPPTVPPSSRPPETARE